MSENLEKITIKYNNGNIEKIDNSDFTRTISVDVCSRFIQIAEYKKHGHKGKVNVRIIPFENITEISYTA